MNEPKISVDNAIIQDGKAIFIFHRSGDLTKESSVRYHTADNTAQGRTVDGTGPTAPDFQHVMGLLVIESGQTLKQIAVSLLSHPDQHKSFKMVIDGTDWGVIERGTATADFGPGSATSPTATIDSVTMGSGGVITPPAATPVNAAFVKAFKALLAKYGKGDVDLDQGTMLGLAAWCTGQLIAVQDPRSNSTETVMAAVNLNLSAGFIAMRAQLNTIANATTTKPTPPPGPGLAKIMTGAPTGSTVN